MAPFNPELSNLISQGLKTNPFYFKSAAPVQPSQQIQKGLKWGRQQLDQALGSAEGIPAMPAFAGQPLTPGFNTQNLFGRPSTAPASAGDRAYESEKNRIAQQTAQNPLFQKYQVADLTKQYNTATTPAEKQRIGLEIWAQTNPLLAAKLKSGQVGYTESRSAPGMSNAGGLPIGGLPMPSTQFNAFTDVSTPGTIEQTFGTPVAGYGMVSATPMVYNPGAPQGPVTDGMIQSSYGQQLLSAPDFAKIAKDKAFLQQAYQQQGLK
jgi:hypothetical protein